MTIRLSRTMSACVGALVFAALPLHGVLAEDAPATAAAAPTVVEAISLRYSTPADVIKLMHWATKSELPDGVQSITEDKEQNKLEVIASADGLATVKQVVKDIDVPRRQIRLEVHEFLASQKEIDKCGINFSTPVEPQQTMGEAVQAASRHEQVMTASGRSIADMLKYLTTTGELIGSPNITTSNNVEAAITFSAPDSLKSFGIQSISVGANPRANSDNTATLRVKIELYPIIAGVPKDPTPPKIVEAIQTVPDGVPFVMANVARNGEGDATKQLVIFITPHLLPLP